MINLEDRIIVTDSNRESENLLKKAVAQGFSLPKGEKAMESCRFFRFIGSPYKSVTTPSYITTIEAEKAEKYSYLFGDELEELNKIVDSATRWCRTYGYEHLNVYVNEEFDSYTGKGIAKTKDGSVQQISVKLQKPRKITISELEEHFGCPIEIVS